MEREPRRHRATEKKGSMRCGALDLVQALHIRSIAASTKKIGMKQLRLISFRIAPCLRVSVVNPLFS